MFRLGEALKVYLHREPIDFRLSINGLALLVERKRSVDRSPLLTARELTNAAGSALE